MILCLFSNVIFFKGNNLESLIHGLLVVDKRFTLPKPISSKFLSDVKSLEFMMMLRKAATEKEANLRTWVIWDIKTCPVPPKFDPSRVGPCIKRVLKNLGYNGDITITAIGILTDVPHDILQSLSSTGIVLCHTPFDALSIVTSILFPTGEFPLPPVNILLISARNFLETLDCLPKEEYNILPPVCFDFSRDAAPPVESFWIGFRKDTMDTEEKEKCSEASECEWICRVCRHKKNKGEFHKYTIGQGFENFTNHLLSEEHHQQMLNFLSSPSQHMAYEERARAYRDSHPKNATTSVNKEPKRKCQSPRGNYYMALVVVSHNRQAQRTNSQQGINKKLIPLHNKFSALSSQ